MIKRVLLAVVVLLFVSGCAATSQQIQKEMQPLVNRVDGLEKRVDTLEKKVADMEAMNDSLQREAQQAQEAAAKIEDTFNKSQQKGM